MNEIYYSEDQGSPVCSQCSGLGEVSESAGYFPNDYCVYVPCSSCGGSGLGEESHEPYGSTQSKKRDPGQRYSDALMRCIKDHGPVEFMNHLRSYLQAEKEKERLENESK